MTEFEYEFTSQMIAQYTRDGRYVLLLTKSIPAHHLISLHAIQGFVNDIHLLHRRFSYRFTLTDPHFAPNGIPVFFETIKRLVREQKAKGIFVRLDILGINCSTGTRIRYRFNLFHVYSILERESLIVLRHCNGIITSGISPEFNHHSKLVLNKENGLSLMTENWGLVFDHAMRGLVLERKEGEWKEGDEIRGDWVSLMITNQLPFLN